MSRALAHVTLLVREYDEAIRFFTERLGFRLLEDTALGEGKRWILVSPSQEPSACLLLARASTPEQLSCVGRQAGDRVFLFLHTDNFNRDHARMRASGVRFLEDPREEAYGTLAVFEDLYGNKWDLLEPRDPPPPR
jgi:catechol 2,3-dioxygenase-like lactoylglutathione lyase family enzyme